VLPGSRLGEISKLGGAFFEAAWQVSERIPGLHVVVPAANPACRALIQEQLSRSALPVAYSHLLDGQARTAMIAADVVVLASGTATLETMLVKRPMVVGYRVAELTYRIVKALGLIKVDRFALPNILAGKDLAPELIQHDCVPDKLAEAIMQWFDQPQRAIEIQDTYEKLHLQLRQDASARAADAVAELLARKPRGNAPA
jgi:lipid-A-disaccharide synthase